LKDAEKSMHKIVKPADESSIAVFNAGGSTQTPVYFEFSTPGSKSIHALQTEDGELYEVQKLTSKEDVFMDTTIGMTAARMGMRLLPGRKLMDFYINGVEYYDGDEPGLLELRFIADRHPVGDFDMESLKQEANEIIGSKKYKKIHLVASRPTQSVYASVIPLTPWSFSKLTPVEDVPDVKIDDTLEIDKNSVSNKFYSILFNKDGSLSLTNKKSGVQYDSLHVFEDYGDRGDEYTFGRVEPEKVKVKDVKRTILSAGPIVAEISQTQTLEVFSSIDSSREKRIGLAKIPVETVFRFYRDTPRIEVTTRLTNTAKDHRLRICFDLPFKSDTTLTSTHFGCIKRVGAAERIPDPEELARTRAEFPEQPSGIQAQKGFIRIDDQNGTDAITVLNRGLPEVELIDGHRIAVTLLRCIGWLSRSDYPERPIHAGPAEATPGAQEMNMDYTFQYGFVVHQRENPVSLIADYADVFHSDPIVFPLDSAEPPKELFKPFLQLDNHAIRISSMRKRGDTILVTLFNIENKKIELEANLSDNIKVASEIKLDGSEINNLPISDGTISLSFNPREIKMCSLR